MSRTEEESKYIHEMRDHIQTGLREIVNGDAWLEEYRQWRLKDDNQFDSLLEVMNPFVLDNVGDRHFFNLSDPEDCIDLDIYCMSVFLSERLHEESKRAFASIRTERNREKKLRIADNYFNLVDSIFQNQNLSPCIVTLNDLAEKQMVLYGKKPQDFYVCFFSLKELLRKRSAESLYLLFTYWRITKATKDLKRLIASIIDYIQTYFDDFDHDPDMHLYYPTDGLINIKKLAVISHWLEHISFHTEGIFEKYKELKWLRPVDTMADEIIGTNQISKFEMLLYKRIFNSDDDKTVEKKAVCNHGYAIWIKTVDVMHFVCDIFQVLYSFSDDDLKRMHATRAAVLEGFDNMTKIRDHYTRKVFFHQVYYQLQRHYLDSQVMEALEDDAERFSESVDDVIKFVGAVAGDDIETLLQTKQRYIGRLSEFVSDEQQEKLDELTAQVVEKIKNTIQKMDVYDTLYSAVSTQFTSYATVLLQHPQILSSLVSAEYLYQQYVESREENNRFDYSCISIMYYMSLEDFINKLVYTPYRNDILTAIGISNPNRDNTWKNTTYRDYLSSPTAFWDSKLRAFKRSCEIGNLGFLLEGVTTESNFKSYLIAKYPAVDEASIQAYGTKLKLVAPRRNDAAHGGNYLTYQDVQTDKGHVYNISVSTYRGLIMELLDILF